MKQESRKNAPLWTYIFVMYLDAKQINLEKNS